MSKTKTIRIMLLMFAGLVMACTGTEKEETDTATNETVTEPEKTGCDALTVEDFDAFLGIKYGSKELSLQNKIGKFTGGEYTEDSSAFVYYFNRVERVPISVWVNGQSGKVETIFMEVLSYQQNFEADLTNAIDEFKMTECDASWFGLSETDVRYRLGKPDSQSMGEDSVVSYLYDSEDYLYSVNFKFYPSQENMCSSVSVNWFYD